jgi:hypothetical protein
MYISLVKAQWVWIDVSLIELSLIETRLIAGKFVEGDFGGRKFDRGNFEVEIWIKGSLKE